MNDEGTTSDLPPHWRQVLHEMQHEWDRLHQEIAQLRTERDQLSRAVVALMGDEVTWSREELLAQMGREKPLRELLQELRASLTETGG